MKVLKLVLSVVLIGIIFYSCQKEVIDTSIEDPRERVSLRSSSPSDCGYINELCNPCRFEVLEQLPDLVSCCGLVIVDDDGNSFKMRSIPLFSESDEYIVTTSSGDKYILTNTTNEYIISHSENYAIPRGLKNIFRLNQTKLESGNYTDIEISNDLGISVSRNERNEIIISTSSFKDFDDDIQARPIDPCKGQFMKILELYLEKLNMPDIITTSASTWMSVVEPVFEDCAEGIDLDVDCIDTKCVIDGLINLESFNWNSDQLKHLKTNYLSLLYGLDETEADALANASTNFIDELFELSDCNSITFCSDIEDQLGVVGSILDQLLASDDLNQSSLNSAVDALENISAMDLVSVDGTSQPILGFSICPAETFPFIEFQDAFYVQMDFVQKGFIPNNPFNTLYFCIPELCLEIPLRNSISDEPFGLEFAQEACGEAFDKAGFSVMEDILSGTITTGPQAQAEFLDYFKTFILQNLVLFDENNVSINIGECSVPNVNSAIPEYSFCGFCIQGDDKCTF